jgi:hypothetical protein
MNGEQSRRRQGLDSRYVWTLMDEPELDPNFANDEEERRSAWDATQ